MVQVYPLKDPKNEFQIQKQKLDALKDGVDWLDGKIEIEKSNNLELVKQMIL